MELSTRIKYGGMSSVPPGSSVYVYEGKVREEEVLEEAVPSAALVNVRELEDDVDPVHDAARSRPARALPWERKGEAGNHEGEVNS